MTSTSAPSQILPRLYLGAYWHATNDTKLAALGVTHIISIMEKPPSFNFHDREYKERPKTLHIPLDDEPSENILQYLDQTTEFIRDALSDLRAVVLVHCYQGVSRSATVVAAYLLATSAEFDSAASALQHLRQKRSVVDPNQGFVNQLDEYAVVCLEKRKLEAGGESKADAGIRETEVVIVQEDEQHSAVS